MRVLSPSHRLPRSGNTALAAGALIQVTLGLEFVLAGLNKFLDPHLVSQFSAFVAAQPGATTGFLAPLVQGLVLPHAGWAAYLAALTELTAGGVLLLSTFEVWRRRFSGTFGSQHGYEPVVALLSACAALAAASVSGLIYVLQGGGLPVLGTAAAFESPIAIELFVVPVALGVAWLEFGRFRALRGQHRTSGHRRAVLSGLGALLLVVGAACAAPAANTTSSGTTITMAAANQFQPVTLNVQRGTSVTWVNSSAVPHSVTDDPNKVLTATDVALPADAQPFDSGFIAPGQSFSHTFDVPGTYRYVCLPHETIGMVATIVVGEASS